MEFFRFQTIAAAPPKKSELMLFEFLKDRWKVPESQRFEIASRKER
jgi:hypothetical protein